MNCIVLQRRLLSCEHPDLADADVAGHLEKCPSCRAWQRRLLEMERRIPLLPVPPSTAKSRFLGRIRAVSVSDGPTSVAHASGSFAFLLPPVKKERALRKVSLAFALAASLLIFALCWWAWPRHPATPPRLAANEQVKLEQRRNAVLHAQTAKERIRRLSTLAEEIHAEARQLVDQRERLDQWARFYSRLIGKDLLEQARQLSAEERLAILKDIAENLANTESEASRFAAQLRTRAPRSAESFQQIALAARNGERDLRALMRG